MKRILLLTLIIISSNLGLFARTFVLIAGVSNYENEQVNLAQTTKDAKAFKKVMDSQTKDIILLTSKYASKTNILNKMTVICNKARSTDRIIFFFSGHGMPGGICTSTEDVISYTELVNLLSTSQAHEKICFIDACHSGSVANEKAFSSKNLSLSTLSKGKSDQIYFVGCRGDEYSIENNWVGAGFFSQALIKGLRGKSDTNENKEITVIELFKYIYKDVVKRSKYGQHPQLIAPKNMYETIVATWK